MKTYRKGANYSDIRRIKALAADGCDADEISRILRIVPECIESFMPKKEKRKRRTKEKIEADKAAEQSEE